MKANEISVSTTEHDKLIKLFQTNDENHIMF